MDPRASQDHICKTLLPRGLGPGWRVPAGTGSRGPWAWAGTGRAPHSRDGVVSLREPFPWLMGLRPLKTVAWTCRDRVARKEDSGPGLGVDTGASPAVPAAPVRTSRAAGPVQDGQATRPLSRTRWHVPALPPGDRYAGHGLLSTLRLLPASRWLPSPGLWALFLTSRALSSIPPPVAWTCSRQVQAGEAQGHVGPWPRLLAWLDAPGSPPSWDQGSAVWALRSSPAGRRPSQFQQGQLGQGWSEAMLWKVLELIGHRAGTRGARPLGCPEGTDAQQDRAGSGGRWHTRGGARPATRAQQTQGEARRRPGERPAASWHLQLGWRCSLGTARGGLTGQAVGPLRGPVTAQTCRGKVEPSPGRPVLCPPAPLSSALLPPVPWLLRSALSRPFCAGLGTGQLVSPPVLPQPAPSRLSLDGPDGVSRGLRLSHSNARAQDPPLALPVSGRAGHAAFLRGRRGPRGALRPGEQGHRHFPSWNLPHAFSGAGACIFPVSELRRRRLREVQAHHQGHTAQKHRAERKSWSLQLPSASDSLVSSFSSFWGSPEASWESARSSVTGLENSD